MKLEKLFKALRGQWSFSRKFKNMSSQKSLGTAKGMAIFSPIENNVLAYEEKGEFTAQSGSTLSMEREYLYSYDPEKDTIEKHFSQDKKPNGLFYSLAFSSDRLLKTATGDHLCKKDRYKASYSFQFEGTEDNLKKFTLTYQVKGPEKDYESETVFEKKRSTL